MVRLGTWIGDDPLFVNLTLSFTVAKPYLSNVYRLFTTTLGDPWA
jgi:hypothetical protein